MAGDAVRTSNMELVVAGGPEGLQARQVAR